MQLAETENMEFFSPDTSAGMSFPYFDDGVSAGFPSPAADFMENSLSLNELLIKNKSATFFVRVRGNSMKDAGIDNGDILIVDRSLTPISGNIAVCYLNGAFTVKHIFIDRDSVWLVPKNDEFEPIRVTSDNEFTIWGVVTSVIKLLR